MSDMRNHQGRIFSGLLIILIGVLFLLGTLGRLDIGDVFGTYWPLFLIFFGLWHIVSRSFRDFGFGFILVVVGAFFLLLNLDVVRGRVWIYFWPIIIIAVGLWILIRPAFRPFQEKIPEIKSKDLDAFTIFSGINRRVDSQEFRGGRATVLFGGIELDFMKAKLAEGKATVDLTAIFGGIKIWAPDDWRVVVDSSSIFGGVEDKHRAVSPTEAKATLFIKASAIFGGIEIR